MNREQMQQMQTQTDCSWDPRAVDPSLERQQLAGEEDQSQPGWDAGA
ncbi:hypothetical protein [Nocardioides sp.]|nr:hypothetical protein [Nocardioides sp.]HXH77341.1 hypothetical protein [Nocardioides sp.]